jgi:hypothetical protein
LNTGEYELKKGQHGLVSLKGAVEMTGGKVLEALGDLYATLE